MFDDEPEQSERVSCSEDAETSELMGNGDQQARVEGGCLYVVATPIGNRQDISARAGAVLRQADVILAEDSRHSRPLLDFLKCRARVVALHDHNEQSKVSAVLSALRDRKTLALISDAGTPLISDPGFHLVNAVRAEGFKVLPVPGACAAIAALSVAGIATNRFTFEGFLPAKSVARKKALASLRQEARTMVFYEAPHRIVESIADMQAVFGNDRQATLARELTKLYEEVISLPLDELSSWLDDHADRCRGEMVVVVAGATKSESHRVDSESLVEHLLEKMSPSDAARLAAKATGDSRRRLYEFAMQLNRDGS